MEGEGESLPPHFLSLPRTKETRVGLSKGWGCNTELDGVFDDSMSNIVWRHWLERQRSDDSWCKVAKVSHGDKDIWLAGGR